MSDISFGSVYRIPITQAGVNAAKKAKLKTLIESYPNGLIGKSKTGHARVSVPDSEDINFIGKLKAIGYKVFQKFEGDNIPKENLDVFIKEKLDSRNFVQKGKQAAKMSKEIKAQRRFERSYTPSAIEKRLEENANMAAGSNCTYSDLQMEKMPKNGTDRASTDRLESLSKRNQKHLDSMKKSKNLEKSVMSPVSVAEDAIERTQKTVIKNDKIRESAKYLELKEKYGEEFAEAVFFGIK